MTELPKQKVRSVGVANHNVHQVRRVPSYNILNDAFLTVGLAGEYYQGIRRYPVSQSD
jgi:hypothetical protein